MGLFDEPATSGSLFKTAAKLPPQTQLTVAPHLHAAVKAAAKERTMSMTDLTNALIGRALADLTPVQKPKGLFG